MILVLERFAYSPESTEGRLLSFDGERYKQICWTLERPWLGNLPNVSCIPDDVYRVEPYTRANGDRSLVVLGNSCCAGPDDLDQDHTRWGILFHTGNAVHDSQGCILPGLDRKPSRVQSSHRAMSRLFASTNRQIDAAGAVYLTIRAGLGAM